MPTDCCSSKKSKTCTRSSDGKTFDVSHRRFSKEKCLTQPIKGFTMRSSCAPYKDCPKK